ncbi:MAG: TraR/DksA family transcriptional regulator [Chlamydiota bacterium]
MALTEAEIEKFKHKLKEVRANMLDILRGSTENVKSVDESAGYSQHQADEGSDDYEKTITVELTSKESDILRQIEHALQRIEDGTYGICEITGKPIPTARLEAIPYATMSVQAQEMLEKGLL